MNFVQKIAMIVFVSFAFTSLNVQAGRSRKSHKHDGVKEKVAQSVVDDGH